MPGRAESIDKLAFKFGALLSARESRITKPDGSLKGNDRMLFPTEG